MNDDKTPDIAELTSDSQRSWISCCGGVMGDSEEPLPRARCGSWGSLGRGRSPSLQSRLDASVAGLEELGILREKQKLLVRQAKQLLAPRPQTCKVKCASLERLSHTSHRGSVGSLLPERTGLGDSSGSLHDSGFLESPAQRRSSYSGPMSKEVERRQTGLTCTSPPIRSPLIPDSPRLPNDLMKKYKRRPLKPGHEAHFEKLLAGGAKENNHRDKTQNDSAFIDECWESSDIVSDNILTVFAQEYTKPKTLNGGHVTYHFPSPMHAVLLQYDQGGNEGRDGSNPETGQEYYRVRRTRSMGSSSSLDALRLSEGTTSTPIKNSCPGIPEKGEVDHEEKPSDQPSKDDVSEHLDEVFEVDSLTKDVTPPPLPPKERRRDRGVVQKNNGTSIQQRRSSHTSVGSEADKTKQVTESTTPETTVTSSTSKASHSSLRQMHIAPKTPQCSFHQKSAQQSKAVLTKQGPDNHKISDSVTRLGSRTGLSDIHEDSDHKQKLLSHTKGTDLPTRHSSRTPSTRSSSSSRMSVTSSEEGYFSHPGSPKNKRHHILSIQSDISFGSTGSNLCTVTQGSDEDNAVSVKENPISKQSHRDKSTNRGRPLKDKNTKNCEMPNDKDKSITKEFSKKDIRQHQLCYINSHGKSNMKDTFV